MLDCDLMENAFEAATVVAIVSGLARPSRNAVSPGARCASTRAAVLELSTR
jgi:hypothetical protein